MHNSINSDELRRERVKVFARHKKKCLPISVTPQKTCYHYYFLLFSVLGWDIYSVRTAGGGGGGGRSLEKPNEAREEKKLQKVGNDRTARRSSVVALLWRCDIYNPLSEPGWYDMSGFSRCFDVVFLFFSLEKECSHCERWRHGVLPDCRGRRRATTPGGF